MRVSASSASPSRMPRGGMKVVNEYLATKEGLAAGEWKRRSRPGRHPPEKGRLRCSRKKTLNCSRAPTRGSPRAKNLGLQIHQRRKNARSHRGQEGCAVGDLAFGFFVFIDHQLEAILS